MTAVASPPSFQSLRLGWTASNGGSTGSTPMNSDDVSRIFMPRKSIQRANSSSSVTSSSSSSSSNSTVTSLSQQNASNNASTGEQEGWSAKKKGTRGIWPSSKPESGSTASNTRQQGPPTTSPASSPSAMSPNHQPSALLPSQHILQPQSNGVRSVNGVAPEDSPAVLALLPLNGTFERKQINVPFRPEVLRIGRQTNAKTIPTSQNGFFDSKVLSRQHAEIWAETNGKIFIRDVKSSNGTFVNGQRLSPENRESEPRELREHDTLELGIDIVSEDQKTVVHHKVSAKVEFAGIFGTSSQLLDLNFGDIDPATGASLLSPINQAGGRGRLANNSINGRASAPQSVAGSHVNIMQQKGLGGHEIKISVDHLAKMLASEMKQAKLSHQSLAQTGDFLHSILASEQEKEKQPLSASEADALKQPGGKPRIPKIDPISRFSEPPAPPPQQPLPEKPDAPRASPSDLTAYSGLRRNDTERPKTSASTSPTNTQSSQILSLIEDLTNAKKQIDSQGARVQELEDLLRQERSARENAEEQIRHRERDWSPTRVDANSKLRNEPTASDEPTPKDAEKELVENPLSEQPGVWTEVNGSADSSKSENENPQAALQERLDAMMAEMEEMKQQMEKYRRRAESAETETSSTKASLGRMIEEFRHENTAAVEKAVETSPKALSSEGRSRKSSKGSASESMSGSTVAESEAPRSPDAQMGQKLEDAVAAVLQENKKGDRLAQSAPYASMLGVVLIGVGLMAYLNSWQKVDK